ncbi:hypothetical protein DXG01_005934 [Tephrocybe rancida]|nr:hypothetical protein DXG01_005934 [Tephrocybe rancida]
MAFRRPWSPEPFEPTLHTPSDLRPQEDDFDPYDEHPQLPPQRQRREASDSSVEALDLADYSRTLRSRQEDGYSAYPPYPSPRRPLASLDTLHPPSLVSRGDTRSSNTQSTSSRPPLRPFSLPPPSRYNSATSRYSVNSPYGPEPRIRSQDSEIDISHFPVWSRSWYNTHSSIPQSLSPPDIYTPLPPSHLHTKRSPFEPGQIYPGPDDFSSDPYDLAPSSSHGHDSTRNLLPWGPDPLDSAPIGSSLKEERLRMLEREFGPKAKSSGPVESADGLILDDNGKPLIGTVDTKGYLVTQGPKKRAALRILQILLTLTAGIPSIYAALVIKPGEPPPPAGKPPAFVLYILSVATFLLLLYLFVLRPCCCSGKRSKGKDTPFSNGMMVLPVQGPLDGKKGKKKKTGKKGDAPNGGDVQVNLIVDPEAFGRREDGSEDDEDDENWSGSVPGHYNPRRKRARRPRRSVFAGLAMEEDWKRARGWAKKLTSVDVVLLVIWGIAFVLIMIGKRCPSGGFNGWCNAYNVSSAAACLLSNADIEALILSGEFFNGPQRSSSPTRSPSPDAGWHDHEMSEEAKRREEQGLDYDPEEERRDLQKAQEDYGESIGMGPGRTGVKGVIRDRDESERLSREKKEREVDEMRKKMEKSSLGGKTFLEEEREKGIDEKVDEIVFRERQAAADRKTDVFGRVREGRFGHLREVGAKGFLNGVENEEKGIWVVVHLYDSSLERCYLVDGTLARLARLYPDTKFLRARAVALGFAKKTSTSSQSSRSRYRDDEDEDDPYGEKEDEEEETDDDNVDLDMLPTMLVYRDGELVHNWVRVDWEAGQAGLEELLDQSVFNGLHLFMR